MYSYRLRSEKGEVMAQATKVKVIVSYEIEYDGKVTEDDIDINDIIRDLVSKTYTTDAITDIKIKTKKVRS